MRSLGILKAMFNPAPKLHAAECLARLREGKAVLVDVREPSEWADGVAQGALLLPMSDLTGPRARWSKALSGIDGREMLLYCASGVRSAMAAKILAGEGYRASNAGTLADWADSGWQVDRGAHR